MTTPKSQYKKPKPANAETNPNPETIFIGVSWPYASGNIHLGHLAGQYVVCDVFARYHRLKGNRTLMVSGSDCHGAPVIFEAERQGISPEELVNKSHKQIVETYKKLGFVYENYTKTMTENHTEVVQKIFLALKELGYLKIQKSKQYYDPNVKRFLPDRYVRGTCPECGATNARGDECPECGEFLKPEDLKNPYSTLSDATPVIKETEHFYLDLAKVQPELKDWIKDKTYWRNWVKEFTNGWLKMGLQPRAVTRDLSFGIPVPVEGWDDKVIYVWLEAVVGYLSAAIEWAHSSANTSGDPSAWEDFWKNPECKHYYFIAGGNVPFHTIIWPAEIIAYNQRLSNDNLFKKYKLPGETKSEPLNLPYDVPANKMLTSRGKKMSKGDKTGIGLEYLLDKYSPDVIRYFFVRYAPENHDREFQWKDFIDANNNELVANIGNFVNRVLSFNKSKLSKTDPNSRTDGGLVPEGKLDQKVAKKIDAVLKATAEHIEKAEFVKAIEAVLEFGSFANKWFDSEQPWVTVKEKPAKAARSIYNCIQIISALRILLKPFLPFTAEKLRQILNLPEEYDANKELETKGAVTKLLDTWKFTEIEPGHKINEPEILFEKLEYTEDLEKADNPEPESYVVTEPLEYDLRGLDEGVVIGKITKLAKHPKSDKLNVVTVDLAENTQLSIVCAAENLTTGQVVPVALEGAKVKSIKTGKPTKIKKSSLQGVPSEGMLCAAYELGVGDNKTEILILPRFLAIDPGLGKSLAKIRSLQFTVADELKDVIPTAWAVFPNIEIRNNRSGELDRWIKGQEKKIRDANSDPSWRNQPLYKEFRTLHEKFGVKDVPGSAEDIIEYVLEQDGIPSINNMVDLYNTFSALTGISIGSHDIDKIEGNIRLVVLEKDLPFKHATTNKDDVAKKGEFCYVDDKGLLCRMDIKQGNRTTVTKDTKNVVVLFGGNKVLDSKTLKKEMDTFKNLVKKYIQN